MIVLDLDDLVKGALIRFRSSSKSVLDFEYLVAGASDLDNVTLSFSF